MKKKKMLALLTALVLIVSLLPLSAAAADNDPAPANPGKYPTILVHGFLGWGEYDDIDAIVPYWGMTSGSLAKYLNDKGYDVHCASTGPFSSCWDRVCELYAQLTGTRTDYGIAHSQKYGHDRYGTDYTGKCLIGDKPWDGDHPINLIGHSFGGVISRTLLDMLVEGRPEEVAAAKAAGEQVNPLFEGGHKGYIHSVTAIAAPHNGASFINATPNLANSVTTLGYNIVNVLGLTSFKGLYDPDLDQFGINSDDEETMAETIKRIMYSDFASHNDSCLGDLTIARTCDRNKELNVQPDVFYFDYYGCRTKANPAGSGQIPTYRMSVLLNIFAGTAGNYKGYTEDYYMDGYGEYETKVSVPSQYLDESWQAGDGGVPCISGFCPYHFNDAGEKVYDPYVEVADGTTSFRKGIWNIFPVKDFDHLGIVGGLLNEDSKEVQALYDEIMANIDNTAEEGGGSAPEPANPFADVQEGSYYYDAVLWAVSHDPQITKGTDETHFSPDAGCTRGQVVTFLWRAKGCPEPKSAANPFTDVEESAYYCKAVLWAAEQGITNGTGETTFSPEDPCTRAHVVTFLWRAEGKPDAGGRSNPFADVPAGQYYTTAVLWAVNHEPTQITNGTDETHFSPDDTCTRGQVVTFLYRDMN